MDCSPPGSSVHGVLQARILEWVAISSCRDLPKQGIESKFLVSPHWQQIDYHYTTWKAHLKKIGRMQVIQPVTLRSRISI